VGEGIEGFDGAEGVEDLELGKDQETVAEGDFLVAGGHVCGGGGAFQVGRFERFDEVVRVVREGEEYVAVFVCYLTASDK
jgi:hypothetical protein